MSSKSLIAFIKPYLRWVILGGTLFFILKTLRDHWQDVSTVQFLPQAGYWVLLAFAITLVAHIWSGWVWHWIFALFGSVSLSGFWSTPVYLKTNVAKYLPGNVWHFFGRVRALQRVGVSTGTAVLSVVMEPLLMAVAALSLACLGGGQLAGDHRLWMQMGIVCGVLVGIHPRIFNPILQRLAMAKAKAQGLQIEGAELRLSRYPLRPLLGEMGFVLLRSLGFIAIVAALSAVSIENAPALVAAFSLAWLMGLIIPGAPGGIGVFEATAIPLLSGQFPIAIVLSSVAVYRLISVLAEVAAAGFVWLAEQFIGSG